MAKVSLQTIQKASSCRCFTWGLWSQSFLDMPKRMNKPTPHSFKALDLNSYNVPAARNTWSWDVRTLSPSPVLPWKCRFQHRLHHSSGCSKVHGPSAEAALRLAAMQTFGHYCFTRCPGVTSQHTLSCGWLSWIMPYSDCRTKSLCITLYSTVHCNSFTYPHPNYSSQHVVQRQLVQACYSLLTLAWTKLLLHLLPWDFISYLVPKITESVSHKAWPRFLEMTFFCCCYSNITAVQIKLRICNVAILNSTSSHTLSLAHSPTDLSRVLVRKQLTGVHRCSCAGHGKQSKHLSGNSALKWGYDHTHGCSWFTFLLGRTSMAKFPS